MAVGGAAPSVNVLIHCGPNFITVPDIVVIMMANDDGGCGGCEGGGVDDNDDEVANRSALACSL